MRSTRFTSAAALAAAALALSACSGAGEPDGSTDPDNSTDPGNSETTASADNVADLVSDAVAERESVHMGIGDGGEPVMDVVLGWAGGTKTLGVRIDTMPGESEADDLQVRLVDDVVYVGAEGEWRSMPVDDPRMRGEDESFDAAFVPALVALDVAQGMEAVAGAVTDAEEIGSEEIEGVDATQWRLTLDTETWLAALPEQSLEGEVDFPETAEVNLWVGPDHLPVRQSYPVGTRGDDEAVNQIDYFEWDADVDVTAPEGAEEIR